MEAIFIYILKTSGLITLFYLAYYILLRKETFFNGNRWFLLSGLITSIVLPFIIYTKTVWVAPASASNNDNYQIFTPQVNTDIPFQIDWNLTLIAIYSTGFLILLIKFAIDFYSLNSVIKGKKTQQQADFKFIDTKESIAPFSYFDYIVYNSSLYSPLELESIIEHEKVHSEQNHTVDVLISRVFCILFWFNPIIWLYKKAILQNLEFIADSEAAQKISDKKAYQYTLLKITTHENCVAITNHFYQSLIKKRIIMLNKNQSKKRNSWKFYVVIPALVAFVLLFQIEVIAKEKESKTEPVKEISKEAAKEKVTSMDVYKIKKNTTDQELKVLAETIKQKHNIDAVFSDVNRDSQNQLTAIKVELKKGTELEKTFLINENKAIKNCGILVITYDDNTKKILFTTDDNINKAKLVEDLKNESFTENSKAESKDNKSFTTTNNNTNKTVSISIQSKGDKDIVVTNSITTQVNTDTKTGSTIKITDTKTGANFKVTSPKDGASKNAEQLIIVDGVIQSDQISLDDLDAQNIKSMSVYKGADAIAKYGSQGQNGVIEIETKK
ncbi:TonB-dependent receptor plug domain-containing protein [Flavobacterium sp. F-65]|uniref:TonB-dependent receptor plug domain-containing protein n=1 Tax=Flavobacterium pisciphilum TaxID=2893755 RepID=A0ABS8MZW4_9FLAO|nr:M56 family metallopeptidase [Flavobacterium sp. F-65]MCC9074292.1 TonB-dependent receptor plug domain-containing protein [Flavobacterium sp. F-65]